MEISNGDGDGDVDGGENDETAHLVTSANQALSKKILMHLNTTHTRVGEIRDETYAKLSTRMRSISVGIRKRRHRVNLEFASKPSNRSKYIQDGVQYKLCKGKDNNKCLQFRKCDADCFVDPMMWPADPAIVAPHIADTARRLALAVTSSWIRPRRWAWGGCRRGGPWLCSDFSSERQRPKAEDAIHAFEFQETTSTFPFLFLIRRRSQ